MPKTAIITTKGATLTIVTAEELYLEELGKDRRNSPKPRKLNSGRNEVSVGPGVFRVVSRSKDDVQVTAPLDVRVLPLEDKTGGPIELAPLPDGFAEEDVEPFLDLKSKALG